LGFETWDYFVSFQFNRRWVWGARGRNKYNVFFLGVCCGRYCLVVVLKLGFVDFPYLSQISHFSCEIGGFSGFLNVGFWRVVRGRFWSLLSVSDFFVFFSGVVSSSDDGASKMLENCASPGSRAPELSRQ
jgi:hypothetical protein